MVAATLPFRHTPVAVFQLPLRAHAPVIRWVGASGSQEATAGLATTGLMLVDLALGTSDR